MQGEMIRMKMSDGADVAVYHVAADGPRRGGLVLVQEIFGVTDHIRDLCDEYAADGYEVLSPALFDREHPGFEADYTGPAFERAVELARQLHPFDQSLADAQTCIDALKDKGPVFITGYCYGGSVAWPRPLGRQQLLWQHGAHHFCRPGPSMCDHRPFWPVRCRDSDGGRRKVDRAGPPNGADFCL